MGKRYLIDKAMDFLKKTGWSYRILPEGSRYDLEVYKNSIIKWLIITSSSGMKKEIEKIPEWDKNLVEIWGFCRKLNSFKIEIL